MTKMVYELEDQDVKVLKHLLNYCYHRAEKHRTPVSGSANEIRRLRKEFGII